MKTSPVAFRRSLCYGGIVISKKQFLIKKVLVCNFFSAEIFFLSLLQVKSMLSPDLILTQVGVVCRIFGQHQRVPDSSEIHPKIALKNLQ
jgi:hypothetical protein